MFFNSLTKKSDEELVALIQQGEERAFTLLYQRYSGKLLRYFFRMLWKDENKAQDFLHDLFMKIVEDPFRYSTSRPFATWIYSVAHNMCKNEYRKYKFREEADKNIVVYQVVSEATVYHDLDQVKFSEAIENILMRYDDDDRNLFVLRCELEMPFIEIATLLNCPEGTVKSRWFYLKKKLAMSLQEYNPITK